MAKLPFWFHPDTSAEAFSNHDHYFDVAQTLAEDFQAELERSRAVIARMVCHAADTASLATWFLFGKNSTSTHV